MVPRRILGKGDRNVLTHIGSEEYGSWIWMSHRLEDNDDVVARVVVG